MRAFLRWTSLVAAVALLTAAAAYAQTIGADGVKAQSLGYTRVGGIDSDSMGVMLKFTDEGYLKIADGNRPEDRSPLNTLLTSDIPGNTVLSTNAFDASQYTSFQIHFSWTVADTATKADSCAFLIIPFGRTTLLDTGDNYLITQAKVLGALYPGTSAYTAADSTLLQYSRTLPGILVTSRGSIYGRSVTWIGQVMRPERVVFTDFGARTGTVFGQRFSLLHTLEKGFLLTKRVSFPLGGAAYGGDVKELYLGFYVMNLSNQGATDVQLDVIPKVN